MPTGQGQLKIALDTGPKSYWWQPVITFSVNLKKLKEPTDSCFALIAWGSSVWCTDVGFTWGGYTEAASHPASTISMPHWWPPIREKQLSVALPSFVGWLEWRSLVAIYTVGLGLRSPGYWSIFDWPWPVDILFFSDYCCLTCNHFYQQCQICCLILQISINI